MLSALIMLSLFLVCEILTRRNHEKLNRANQMKSEVFKALEMKLANGTGVGIQRKRVS